MLCSGTKALLMPTGPGVAIGGLMSGWISRRVDHKHPASGWMDGALLLVMFAHPTCCFYKPAAPYPGPTSMVPTQELGREGNLDWNESSKLWLVSVFVDDSLAGKKRLFADRTYPPISGPWRRTAMK